MKTLYRVEIDVHTYVAAESGEQAAEFVRKGITYGKDLNDELASGFIHAREVRSLDEIEAEERDQRPWGADDDKTIAEYFTEKKEPP